MVDSPIAIATTVIFHPEETASVNRRRRTSVVATSSSGPKEKTSWYKLVKIVIPHVLLNTFLFAYLILGAYMFQRLESKQDQVFLARKGERILGGYRNISRALQSTCPRLSAGDLEWKRQLYSQLHQLSFLHDKISFSHITVEDLLAADEVMPRRWTMIQSVLYAVSILTTTGYNQVTPSTAEGKCAAIVYGLIGIPLAVLTALDSGRFLSDAIMTSYKAMKSKCRGSKVHKVKVQTATVSIMKTPGGKTVKHTASILKKGPSKKLTRIVTPLTRRRHKDKNRFKKRKLTLPIWVNGAILLAFCGLGAITYRWFDNTRTLNDAFFIAFNLVANLTMAEMTADTMVAVIYIVCFVTFGLVVLSMCADLAASELLWILTKIHYFGRRIGQRKRRQHRLDEQVAALVQIMEEIRAKHPEKTQITPDDLKEYMIEATAKMKMAQLKAHMVELSRRNTQPFVPGQELQFVDDADATDDEVVDGCVVHSVESDL